MQKRGRMAEVSGGIVAGGVLLLYLLSVSQGDIGHFPQLYDGAIPVSTGETWQAALHVFCIFIGIGLLPLLLPKVEKSSGAARPALRAVWMLGLILAAGLVLLQGAFGAARLSYEKYPIVPLMAGANLPGDILGRFDVIWMGILLYSLLFSIGSLQFYGTHILQSLHLETLRWWVAAAMVFFSWVWLPDRTLQESYPWILQFIFCPGFLVILAVLWIYGRKKGFHKLVHRRKED